MIDAHSGFDIYATIHPSIYVFRSLAGFRTILNMCTQTDNMRQRQGQLTGLQQEYHERWFVWPQQQVRWRLSRTHRICLAYTSFGAASSCALLECMCINHREGSLTHQLHATEGEQCLWRTYMDLHMIPDA